jgi:CheY-like chemotaxis protein
MRNTVLIVEDNPVNLDLIADLLEANQFVVWRAESAENGLRLARQPGLDIILMDLSLPGMDGLAATKAIKADAATAHLPVIALTANAMRGDEALALSAGCDAYLSKPIDTRTLPAKVSAVIASARARRPASPPL